MKRIQLFIDEPIRSGNVILRQGHWAPRGRLKALYRDWIWIALLDAGIQRPEERPKVKMKLRITSYRLKELDEDNLATGAKILIDAIKELRLIRDDSPKWIKLELRQVVGKEKHGTEIEIEEVSGADLKRS